MVSRSSSQVFKSFIRQGRVNLGDWTKPVTYESPLQAVRDFIELADRRNKNRQDRVQF